MSDLDKCYSLTMGTLLLKQSETGSLETVDTGFEWINADSCRCRTMFGITWTFSLLLWVQWTSGSAILALLGLQAFMVTSGLGQAAKMNSQAFQKPFIEDLHVYF